MYSYDSEITTFQIFFQLAAYLGSIIQEIFEGYKSNCKRDSNIESEKLKCQHDKRRHLETNLNRGTFYVRCMLHIRRFSDPFNET